MRKTIADLIARYGRPVRLIQGEHATQVQAFLQPVTSKSWQNMERLFGPLGEIPRGQYLYMGPVDADFAAADRLECGNRVYLPRRADLVYFGQEPIYCWGLCVEGSAAEWNS